LAESIGAKEAAEKVAELLFDGFTALVRLNPCPITAGEMLQTCFEFAHQHDLKNFWGNSISDGESMNLEYFFCKRLRHNRPMGFCQGGDWKVENFDERSR